MEGRKIYRLCGGAAGIGKTDPLYQPLGVVSYKSQVEPSAREAL